MLLAGDVGGTKTLLGLFERGRAAARGSSRSAHLPHQRRSPASRDILDAFARDVGAPFVVDGRRRRRGRSGRRRRRAADEHRLGRRRRADRRAARRRARVRLLNDLEAMALGAGVLGPDEMVELQRGDRPRGRQRGGDRGRHRARRGVPAPGQRPADGRWPSEGGHARLRRADRSRDRRSCGCCASCTGAPRSSTC